MPATDNQGGSFLGRSILSIRRNQVASMEGTQEQELEDMDIFFLKHTADRFVELSSPEVGLKAGGGCLLSLAWLRKLIDVFLSCEEEFKAIVILRRGYVGRPPLDRPMSELLDRAVKALDVCNAITHGVESIQQWHKQAQIAVTALQQTPLAEGQLRRARKALAALLASIEEEEQRNGQGRGTDRNWSFGKKGTPTAKDGTGGTRLKSLSWGVSRAWSASRQLHAMAGSLVVPRGAEATGLGLPIYTMSVVMVFVAWALVTAVPCQDRNNLPMHFPPPPKRLAWAAPVISLQERIAEEWRNKEKRGSMGLMEELLSVEKCASGLIESTRHPLEEERAEEIRSQVNELAETCRRMDQELGPFQLQIREAFHRIARNRNDVLDLMAQSN